VARLSLRPASLVRIEQQLTQGDENDGADDRRRSMCGTSNAAQVQEALQKLLLERVGPFILQPSPGGKPAEDHGSSGRPFVIHATEIAETVKLV
jgi:hypothetical protein